MQVFLTGATGYIGSLVAEKLQAAGHTVIDLARSSATATRLEKRQIVPFIGDLPPFSQSTIKSLRIRLF